MPSLNSKRQVRYTAADLNAIDGALTVLQFMKEFEANASVSGDINSLRAVQNFISEQRKKASEKQPTKPA